MYWVAGGFIFRRVNSPFHSLDPRVKLLVSAELFVVSLTAYSVTQLAVVMAVMLSIAAVSKILKRVGRTLIFSAGFSVFIFVINLFATHSLLTSAVYSARFLAIIISTSLFFITTSPDELEQVMKSAHLPRDVVFAFTTAVRFIPVLMLDAIQIVDAQKSRGLEVEKGNLIRRVRKMVPVLIPLVVNSVIRSGELAEAMESRAYGAVSRPTSLYRYSSTKRDKLVAVGSLILFVITVYIYVRLPAPL